MYGIDCSQRQSPRGPRGRVVIPPIADIPSGLGDVLSVVIALVCFAIFWLLIEGLRRI
jgi:hypothetical protein